MKLNKTYPLVFVATVATLFATSTPVRASETDEKIDASFKQTYVYKTYLKDDSVKTEAKDGLVTLTGTVS